MTASQIIKRLRRNTPLLREKHKVSALYLFGSAARGEATPRSDVDILVEFSSRRIGIFEFVRLKEFLESILGRRVDLVTRDALKDWMLSELERDSIRAA